jgi:hypothetical protein
MKLISKIFLPLLLLFVFFNPASAQETFSTGVGIEPGIALDKIAVPSDYQQGTFFGQNHTYSVVFRGNGEAVVSARVVVGNSGETPLKEIKLRVPNVQATGIFVFQIFKEKTCMRYSTSVYDQVLRRYPPAVCEEYQDPDYYNDYSYYNAKYKKADYEFKNDTLTIKLPSSIAAGKSGAFFVYFRTFGYAKKNAFGAYTYKFESLQVEDSIRSLSVGISTDSDLYLKGVTGEVNYRYNDVSTSMAKLNTAGVAEGVASPAMDSYVSSIGQGSIYKSASDLAPLESYKVEGAYADSKAKLYGKELLIGAGVLLLIVAVLVIVVIAVVRMLKKPNPPSEAKTVTEVKEKAVAHTVSNGKMFAVSVLLGFVVSLLTVIYTALVIVLGILITRNVVYSYQSLVVIVLVIISILIYILLIFAPGVLVGVKKGVAWGIGTVVSTILWLIFWTVIIFLGFFLFGNSNNGGIGIIQPLTKALY